MARKRLNKSHGNVETGIPGWMNCSSTWSDDRINEGIRAKDQ